MASFARSGDAKYTRVNTQNDDESFEYPQSVPPSPCNSAATSGNSEIIYTPSESNDHSSTKNGLDDNDDALESDILLPSPPPGYQNAAASTGDVALDVKNSHGASSQNDHSTKCSHADSESGCRKPRERGCCGRMKCRRQDCTRRQMTKKTLFFGIVKFVLLLGVIHLVFSSIFYREKRHHDYQGGHRHDYDDVSASSREIIVHKTSDGIWGRYPLYDLLSMSTTSGSISIVIDPKPADPNNPTKPAKVVLRSGSGSISVQFRLPNHHNWHQSDVDEYDDEIEKLEDEIESTQKEIKYTSKRTRPQRTKRQPSNCKNKRPSRIKNLNPLSPRPYDIEIETRSGTINANIAFSTRAELSSRSGSINARLTPLVFHDADYLDSHRNVSITTTTRSGSTSFMLNEPLIFPAPTTGHIPPPPPPQPHGGRREPTAAATHTSSGSGSVQVTYPQSWAGHVHASSRSGGICMGGEGLHVIKQGRKAADGVKEPEQGLPGEKRWWGSRGDMDVDVGGRRNGAVGFWVRSN
ncbi:hypothetical protein PRK78_000707 [Emydomyces testavorans]|uniref:Uncharacterized protein n=1 Tax=Emydomyces testavorans TaxID=2070801 RepID=A0AAF0DBP5_9EURO|nr:hypothetical protein PRK78_000707 [Emydomyces testavorans]